MNGLKEIAKKARLGNAALMSKQAVIGRSSICASVGGIGVEGEGDVAVEEEVGAFDTRQRERFDAK